MSEHVVWTDTREAVRALVDQVASCESDMARMTWALDAFGRESDSSPPATVAALAELLDQGTTRERCVAAAFLVQLRRWKRANVGGLELARAKHVLQHTLRMLDEGDRLFAALLLCGTEVPTECVPELFRCMHEPSEPVRYTAACALSTVDPREVHLLAARREGAMARSYGYELSFSDVVGVLESGTADAMPEEIRCISVSGLLRLLPDSERVVLKAVELLATGKPGLKVCILQAIEAVAPKWPKLALELTKLVLRADIPSVVRGGAAETLGMLTAGTQVAVPILLGLLTSTEHCEVRGAIAGLRAAKAEPEQATRRFIELLSSEHG